MTLEEPLPPKALQTRFLILIASRMSEAALEGSSEGLLESPKVQVDLGGIMGGFIGRIKEKPVCQDQTLKKEAMSTAELSKLAFCLDKPSEPVAALAVNLPQGVPAAPLESSIVSSASSTASRESAYLSDLDGNTSKVILTPLRLERRQSDAINQKVTSQKISRNGRMSQRWYTDPQNQRVYRMVTGCVPIVEGGKILFVSASRKPEWILPKGGWESDEAMEESAIRESFEEAGVVGILGPRLNEFEYESRKSKKRRLDQEEAQKRAKKVRDAHAISPDPKSEINSRADEEPTCTSINVPAERAAEDIATVSNEEMARIQGQSKSSDETCSVASDSSAGYTHVRLTLFPLYVSEVKAEWPESGRFRKAIDIDEAIRITANRPEFQVALMEVKERNLHLPPRQESKTYSIKDR